MEVRLVVTEGDPRLDSVGKEIFRQSGLTRESAHRRATAWARAGYWSSIYAPDGECLDEVKPVQ